MTPPANDDNTLFNKDSTAENEDLITLEGTLDNITFHNEENGFTIARLRTSQREMITIIGTFINPLPGEALQLAGRWETHKQYGAQFRIDHYQVIRPATILGMEKYLGSGLIKGIGPKTAKLLVKHFGLETIEVIDDHGERLLEVPGIGQQKAQLIRQAWSAQREVRNIMLFLHGHGISASFAAKIFRTYGDRAVEIVNSNPYRLAQDIFGIGFRSADRVARKIGLKHDTPERLEAGIIFSLRQAAEQGHCFMPEAELAANARELLTAIPEGEKSAAENGEAPAPPALTDINAAIDRLVRTQLLVRDTDDPELSPIYQKSLFIMELHLGRMLQTLLACDISPTEFPGDQDKLVTDICRDLGFTPADIQRQAIRDAMLHRVMILTGGPGTGKTTTTQAILQTQLRNKRQVLLASPTGRAAKRLAEVTGFPAQTLHRLLEVDPQSFTFKRNADNPLECDTLIVDEASMLDLHLAHSMVRALPPGAQLILVGDADQLPSVGAGNVLRDLINSNKVPVVCLQQIFRQAATSTIITNAHLVNHGEMPELPGTREWQNKDCLFIEQNDAEIAAKKICDVVSRSLPGLGYTLEEIQVLTPMQRGPLGAQNLNILLQQQLNPRQIGIAELSYGQKILRSGDRVIQTVNNYNKDVFNGDIGYLREIDNEEKCFTVAYPERSVEYSFDEADELFLAYALTVHKSQGSEYPALVLAFHTQHYLLLQRNLLYTALTRARKMALIIGSKRAIAMAVRNASQRSRYTRLSQRLQLAKITTDSIETG